MEIGKTMIFVGLFLVIIGILFLLFGKISFFGKLPGDITYERENFRFYAPIATSIIISIVLMIIINIFLRVRN